MSNRYALVRPQGMNANRATSFVIRSLLAFGLAALFAATVQDPEPAAKSRSPIDDFAWLAGHWRGEGFGGICEEIWSEPLAGTMVGTFRLVKDDAVSFYEIMVLDKDEKGISLKVKHFSKDFVAWEEKPNAVRFELESVRPNDARFSGLTLRRDDDKLAIKVRMRSPDGKSRWEPIELEKSSP